MFSEFYSLLTIKRSNSACLEVLAEAACVIRDSRR